MEHLKNITVSDFAKINHNLLSGFLTVMLCVNALGITIAVSLLDKGFTYPENLGIAISVFSCAAAVILFFMIKKYIETVTYKFFKIDSEKMKSISKIAKRVFWPFALSIAANILFAVTGSLTLLWAILEKSL